MKKIVFLLGCLFIIISTFSQRQIRPIHDKDYYLQRSAQLRKTSLILLCSGAVVTTVGILVINNNITSGDFNTGLTSTLAGVAVTVIGAASMITSIPLFAVSQAMKRKGIRLAFNNRPFFTPLQKNGFAASRQPTLTLSIRL